MYVIEYKNERGISCEADFHDLKTCLDYVINDVRISCSDEIHIKKVYKYWNVARQWRHQDCTYNAARFPIDLPACLAQ